MLMFFVGGSIGAFVIYWFFVRINRGGYTERLRESMEMNDGQPFDNIAEAHRQDETRSEYLNVMPSGVINENVVNDFGQ